MQIETASVDTLVSAVDLLGLQFEEHRIALPREELTTAVKGLISDRTRGAIFLARESDFIGLAVLAYTWTLEHGGLVAWLDELFVVSAHRGRGVGCALLHHAVDVAREDGCLAVELEVDAKHARAEHLYRREGFARLTRRRWSLRVVRD
jgi:GNAT superfamily N-acetyltransferase